MSHENALGVSMDDLWDKEEKDAPGERSKPEAKLRLYIGGNVKARLDVALPCTTHWPG